MTNMLHSLRRASSAAIVCGGLALPIFVAAAQQSSAGHAPQWQAFVGCWQQVVEAPDGRFGALPPTGPSPVVCIAPGASQTTVDVVTVDSSKVLSRYAVDASGASHAVNRDGCIGSESAHPSQDGLRIFLKSDVTCNNSLQRTSTGVMSIASDGQWVDVQSVIVAGNDVVRAVRYRRTAPPAGLPADVATLVASARRLENQAATVAAGAPLTAGAIAEAAHTIDTSAVQAWLVERHDSFKFDAKTLIAMADAGVPGSVTDVMVALANPDEFHFTRGPVGGSAIDEAGLTRADSARIASDYLWRRGAACDSFSMYSPYGWGVDPCDMYGDLYGFSRYGYGYGYNPYYGYGRYGYSGYGGYPGYYYSGPVIIVPNAASTPHGRAVNGQGYTRGSSSGSSSSGSTATRSSGSSGGSSAASGGGSSGSSSSSSTSGRTAHIRP